MRILNSVLFITLFAVHHACGSIVEKQLDDQRTIPETIEKKTTIPLATPVPFEKGAVTQKDFSEILLRWWRKTVVDPYRKRHPENSAKDKVSLDFLEAYCQFRAKRKNISMEALLDKGRRIVYPKNPDSSVTPSCGPLVSGCYGELLVTSLRQDDVSGLKAADPLLSSSLKELEHGKYDLGIVMLVADRLMKVRHHTLGGWGSHYDKCAELMAKLFSKKNFNSDDQLRVAYQLLFDTCWLNGKNVSTKVLKKMQKLKIKPSSWLENMIRGKIAVDKAWDARGSGWASTVTKDGWRLFKKYGNEAGDHFRKAWVERPKLPEAPANLIIIAMAGVARAGEDEEFWFRKALKGQFDYEPAYNRYFWALRPRWGGSHAAMLGLGLRAYATKRFDTDVPRHMLYALLKVSQEFPVIDRRPLFRQPMNKRIIDDIYTSTLDLDSWSELKRNRRTLEYAFCKAWMGEYSAARELYLKTPKNISLKNLFNGSGKHMIRYRAFFENELYVFNGPYASLAKRWEDALLRKDFKTAGDLEKKLLSPQDTPDLRVRRYILDRSMAARHNRNPKKFSVLYSFVSDKKIKQALQMIADGADVNDAGSSDWTPLLYAAWADLGALGKPLIDAGANIEAKTYAQWTPLMEAARNSDPAFVTLLLKHGAKVNVENNHSYTPLIVAALNKKHGLENMRVLIKHGAKLNVRNDTKKSALHYAASKDKKNIVSLLISSGAKVDEPDKNDWTPLHYAARYADVEVVEFFMKAGADIKKFTNWHSSPLHLAVFNKKNGVEIAKLLIAAGNDVDSRSKDGNSSLYDAVSCANLEFTKILLASKADLELRNTKSRKTPLHQAVYKKDPEFTRLLLDSGANPNALDHIHSTPLGNAIYNKNRETALKIVELLLANKKTDLNIGDCDTQTPLFWAAREGRLEIAKRLLAAGADKTIKDKYGKTAYDIARTKEMKKLLSNDQPSIPANLEKQKK